MKFHSDGSGPEKSQIFVFGSNISGIHGGGAAKAAHQQYGAQWGVAEGLTGRSYAIPTVKEHIVGALPLLDIYEAIMRFVEFAMSHPEIEFFITRVGCGLAGHKDANIAPIFAAYPLRNCSYPDTWKPYMETMK